MSTETNVAEGYDIRQKAVEAVRPAWSDAALDQFECMETDEPDAVRFAGKIDGVEFHQWADDEGGRFVLSDGPYVTTHTIPDLDELPMAEVAELGVTLTRISQFIALADEEAIEVGMLRLSDLALIAKRQGTTTTALLLAVGRRGDAAPEEVSS